MTEETPSVAPADKAESHIERTQIWIRRMVMLSVLIFLAMTILFGAFLSVRAGETKDQTDHLVIIAKENQEIGTEVRNLAKDMKILLEKAQPCIEGDTPPAPACAVNAERARLTEEALRRVAEEEARQHNRILQALKSSIRVSPTTTIAKSTTTTATTQKAATATATATMTTTAPTTTTTCPRLPNGKCSPKGK